MTIPTPKRLATFAFVAAFAFAACSSSGSSASPTTAASASAAAPTTAASAEASASATAASGSAAAVACATGSITADRIHRAPAARRRRPARTTTRPARLDDHGPGRRLRAPASPRSPRARSRSATPTSPPSRSSRPRRRLVDHIVAKQGWVMVVNQDVTGVTNLTTAAGDGHLDRQGHQLEGRRRQRRGDRPDPSPGIVRHPCHLQEDRARRRRRGPARPSPRTRTARSRRPSQRPPARRASIGFAYYQQNKATLTGLQLDGVDATVDNMTTARTSSRPSATCTRRARRRALARPSSTTCSGPDVQGRLIPALFYAPRQVDGRHDDGPELAGPSLSAPGRRGIGRPLVTTMAECTQTALRSPASADDRPATGWTSPPDDLGRRGARRLLVGAAARSSSAGTASRSSRVRPSRSRTSSPNWTPHSATPRSASCRSSSGTLGVMVVAAIIATPLSIGLALFMSRSRRTGRARSPGRRWRSSSASRASCTAGSG